MPTDSDKDFLEEFIECYHKHPELWDTTCPKYRRQHIRHEGYMTLVKIMKKVKKDANLDDVKRKINSLRTGYRREWHKVREIAARNAVFKPTLWWFHQMDFLKEQEETALRKDENPNDDNTEVRFYQMCDTMTTINNEEEEFWFEFIECYRLCPALWDSKCKSSSRRRKMEQGNLLKKYRERFPNAGVKEMGRKIHSLRSNHRRESKRLLNLNRNGTGHKHVSNLWYFDAMSFINDIEPTCSTRSSVNVSENESQRKRSRNCQENETDDDFDKPEETSNFIYADETYVEELPESRFQPIKEEDSPQNSKICAISPDPIHCSPSTMDSTSQECEKIVEVWALKLQKMQPNQQLLAEKFVNEILFEGQMGTLHRNSLHLDTFDTNFDEFVEAAESE